MGDVKQHFRRVKAPREDLSSAPIKDRAGKKRRRKVGSWIAGFGNQKTVKKMLEAEKAVVFDAAWLPWLRKLEREPIRRDGTVDGIPFDVATRMLSGGVIEPGVLTRSAGMAVMSWRVWRISERGFAMLTGDQA